MPKRIETTREMAMGPFFLVGNTIENLRNKIFINEVNRSLFSLDSTKYSAASSGSAFEIWKKDQPGAEQDSPSSYKGPRQPARQDSEAIKQLQSELDQKKQELLQKIKDAQASGQIDVRSFDLKGKELQYSPGTNWPEVRLTSFRTVSVPYDINPEQKRVIDNLIANAGSLVRLSPDDLQILNTVPSDLLIGLRVEQDGSVRVTNEWNPFKPVRKDYGVPAQPQQQPYAEKEPTEQDYAEYWQYLVFNNGQHVPQELKSIFGQDIEEINRLANEIRNARLEQTGQRQQEPTYYFERPTGEEAQEVSPETIEKPLIEDKILFYMGLNPETGAPLDEEDISRFKLSRPPLSEDQIANITNLVSSGQKSQAIDLINAAVEQDNEAFKNAYNINVQKRLPLSEIIENLEQRGLGGVSPEQTRREREYEQRTKTAPKSPLFGLSLRSEPIGQLSEQTINLINEKSAEARSAGKAAPLFGPVAEELATFLEGFFNSDPQSQTIVYSEEDTPEKVAGTIDAELDNLIKGLSEFGQAIAKGEREEVLSKRFSQAVENGLTPEQLRASIPATFIKDYSKKSGKDINQYTDFEIVKLYIDASEKRNNPVPNDNPKENLPFFYLQKRTEDGEKAEEGDGLIEVSPSVQVKDGDDQLELRKGQENMAAGNIVVTNRARTDETYVYAKENPDDKYQYSPWSWVVKPKVQKQVDSIRRRIEENERISYDETVLLNRVDRFNQFADDPDYAEFVDNAKKAIDILFLRQKGGDATASPQQTKNMYSWILNPEEWAIAYLGEEEAPEEVEPTEEGIATAEGIEEEPSMEQVAPADVQVEREGLEDQYQTSEEGDIESDTMLRRLEEEVLIKQDELDEIEGTSEESRSDRVRILKEINSLKDQIQRRQNEILGIEEGPGQFEQASLDATYGTLEDWKDVVVPSGAYLNSIAGELEARVPEDMAGEYDDLNFALEVLTQQEMAKEKVASVLRNDQGKLGERLKRIKNSPRVQRAGVSPGDVENNLFTITMNKVFLNGPIGNTDFRQVERESAIDEVGEDEKALLRRVYIPVNQDGVPFATDAQDFVKTDFFLPRPLARIMSSQKLMGGDEEVRMALGTAPFGEKQIQEAIDVAIYKLMNANVGNSVFAGLRNDTQRNYRLAMRMKKEWQEKRDANEKELREEFEDGNEKYQALRKELEKLQIAGDKLDPEDPAQAKQVQKNQKDISKVQANLAKEEKKIAQKIKDGMRKWNSENPSPERKGMVIEKPLPFDPTDPANLSAYGFGTASEAFQDLDASFGLQENVLFDFTRGGDAIDSSDRQAFDNAVESLSARNPRFRQFWTFFGDPERKQEGGYFRPEMFPLGKDGNPEDLQSYLDDYQYMIRPISEGGRKARLERAKTAEEGGDPLDGYTGSFDWPRVIRNWDNFAQKFPGFEYRIEQPDKTLRYFEPDDPDLTEEMKQRFITKAFRWMMTEIGNSVEIQSYKQEMAEAGFGGYGPKREPLPKSPRPSVLYPEEQEDYMREPAKVEKKRKREITEQVRNVMEEYDSLRKMFEDA